MQAFAEHEREGVSRCTLQATEEQKFGMPYFGFCTVPAASSAAERFCLTECIKLYLIYTWLERK